MAEKGKPAGKGSAPAKGSSKSYKMYKVYTVSGDSIQRNNRTCPKCGVFMGKHKNRNSCGKCGYTEMI
jgi:ubiquitin-small subunit ribosomal protein S27Ae